MNTTNNRPSGMTGFTVVWVGQLVSLLGTSMTNFALTIWAFEQTGRATDLALIAFFFMVPLLIVSPVAGAIVDRNDRKLMMMVSDLASGRYPPELHGRLWEQGLIGDDEELWPFEGEYWADEYSGWR